MVSAAYLFQAIKGGNFPATKEQLMERVERKRELPVWQSREDILDTILEFLEAFPDGSNFLNPSETIEKLGQAHAAIEQGATFSAMSQEGEGVHAEREEGLPLRKGGLQGDFDLAARISEIHTGHLQEQGASEEEVNLSEGMAEIGHLGGKPKKIGRKNNEEETEE